MFALLLSLVIHAQEIRLPILQGDYQVSETFEIQSELRWQDIQEDLPGSLDKIESLKSQGFSCSSILGGWVRCTLRVVPPENSPELREILARKWGQDVFSFYALIAAPKLVSNTEFFKQWIVTQKVVRWEKPHEILKDVWNPVTYTWTTGDLWQCYLRESQDNVYIPLTIGKDQNLMVSDSVEISKNGFQERFNVRVELKKVAL